MQVIFRLEVSMQKSPHIECPIQNKIQLRNTFDVICTTNYRFDVFTPLGSKPVGFDIPMKVKLKGMSEKYWK